MSSACKKLNFAVSKSKRCIYLSYPSCNFNKHSRHYRYSWFVDFLTHPFLPLSYVPCILCIPLQITRILEWTSFYVWYFGWTEHMWQKEYLKYLQYFPCFVQVTIKRLHHKIYLCEIMQWLHFSLPLFSCCDVHVFLLGNIILVADAGWRH